MPIEYLSEGTKFSLSYKELREHYLNFCDISDSDFLKNLPEALHLACIICFLKEVPTYVCLTDKGIIHELVHLLKDNGTTTSLQEIRELFKVTLRLA
jgi:hypothetical protein